MPPDRTELVVILKTTIDLINLKNFNSSAITLLGFTLRGLIKFKTGTIKCFVSLCTKLFLIQ